MECSAQDCGAELVRAERVLVARTAIAGQPMLSPHCTTKQGESDPFNAKRFARHSASFRKAAEEAWHAARNGDAPFETGFSIDKDGQPGKVQLSILATADAATHLRIASSSSALGTLHVHNKFGEPTPSPGDIQSARMLGKLLYVESRTGLYSVNPDGTVRHLFNDLDWFTEQVWEPTPAAIRRHPIRRFPAESTQNRILAGTTVVALYSAMTAGPA